MDFNDSGSSADIFLEQQLLTSKLFSEGSMADWNENFWAVVDSSIKRHDA